MQNLRWGSFWQKKLMAGNCWLLLHRAELCIKCDRAPRSGSEIHQWIKIKAINYFTCPLHVQSQQKKTLEKCVKYIQSEQ